MRGSVQHLVPRFQLRPAAGPPVAWNQLCHLQSTGERSLQYLSMPAMDESIRWGSRRCLTLLLVILAHAGLLAWLVSSLRAMRAAAEPSVESVQLVFLPPRMMPRIRVEAPQPLHVRTGTPAAPPPL